jgi:hypothetical protein
MKGQARPIEELKVQDSDQFIQVNFGHGKEIWILPNESREIDLELRAFRGGHLLHPTPKKNQIVTLCQRHGKSIVQMMIK